jgi:hypothetical protein
MRFISIQTYNREGRKAGHRKVWLNVDHIISFRGVGKVNLIECVENHYWVLETPLQILKRIKEVSK